MINLDPSIRAIENLLNDGSNASLTYAALECRLAIELICYEHLRLAHDYISHDDLRKWQPKDVVNTLIEEVDANTASTYELSVSSTPIKDGTEEPSLEEYEAKEYVPVGKHVGFDPKKLGRLWNALSKLALHVSLPKDKKSTVQLHVNGEKTREKIEETLREIKKISSSTLMMTGTGEEVSFQCICGTKNKRRYRLLKDRHIVSCINSKCNESYEYEEETTSFARRTLRVTCRECGVNGHVPQKEVSRLRTDQSLCVVCSGCGDHILLQYRLVLVPKEKTS